MEPRPWHRHYDYNVPTTIRYPRLPIHELLQIPANAYPDKAALNFFGTEMTFWELRQQVLRMANALGALGIKKGDRVGIHLPNCPQYPIAYYAVLSLGAIIVNINPMYTPDELKLIVGSTGLTTLHGSQPGPGKGVAPFFHAPGRVTQREIPPGPGIPGRSRPDPVYRGNHGDSQRSRSHPRQCHYRDFYMCSVGKSHHPLDSSRAAFGGGRLALLPCLWKHRGDELGYVQLRHPDPDPPF